MVLSPQLATGRAVGQFFEAPGKPLHGTVTFTASISHASAPVAEPNPFTVLPRPQQGVIDSQGFLCTAGPDALAGERGVVLVAVDNPELSTVGWHWVVSIRQTDEEGNWLATLPSFPVHVLTGEEVDLSRSMRLPVGEVISVDQAKALADAAERHASAARGEAVAARKDATTAAGAAVDAAGDAAAAGAAAAQSREAARAAEAFTGRASASAAAAEDSAGAAEVSAGAAREQATTAAGAAQAAAREAAQAKTVAGESRDAAAAAAGSAAQATDAAASSATDAGSSAVNARQALEQAENAASSADRATEVVRRADAGEFVPNITIGTVNSLPSTGTAKATVRGTAKDPILDLDLVTGGKGDAGIGWLGTPLGSVDLNSVLTPGLYFQSDNTLVVPEKNYPNTGGETGQGRRLSLEVLPWGSSAVIHRITIIGNGSTTGASQRPRVTYERYGWATWSAWSTKVSQRVDNTAGRAIYTWDDTANREQLIYGDTGWRVHTASNIGTKLWDTTTLRLRRIGNEVEFLFIGLNPTGITTPVDAQSFVAIAQEDIPTAFRPTTNMYFTGFGRFSQNTGSATPRQYVLGVMRSSGGMHLEKDETAPGGVLVGPNSSFYISGSYSTLSSWPTTLPGVAA